MALHPTTNTFQLRPFIAGLHQIRSVWVRIGAVSLHTDQVRCGLHLAFGTTGSNIAGFSN
jgi:hypothetical protein